ncbi:hypothetical protein [Kluyvera intermedia]|uniref:Uncharacterized protein n=1 Tax=Kluyvera intermedia TaxID=61648 RepID=A0AA95G8B4_KLUIN|nr:hypothetical protein [Kluyvera intermedia]WGL57914.1 hypothetical protein QBD33_09240 [Kluyvera intermedia]
MLRIGQVESSATADGKYTDGSVAGGIAATRLRAAAFNAIQEELANIVESAGMSLDPNDTTQVLAALNKKFEGRLVGIQVITASQTYTKTPGTQFAVIEVQGAGGAGGGASAVTTTATCSIGCGGTNGAYAKVVVITPEDQTLITIGSGGVGVQSGVGGSGGTTSFGPISASGGLGGNTMSPSTTPTFAGTNGATGVVVTTGADKVIKATPVVQPLTIGIRMSGTIGFSGAGGMSEFGYGGYGRASSANGLVGIDGIAYGSGGGGAAGGTSAGAVAYAGGDGADGVVVIWEYA